MKAMILFGKVFLCRTDDTHHRCVSLDSDISLKVADFPILQDFADSVHVAALSDDLVVILEDAHTGSTPTFSLRLFEILARRLDDLHPAR